MRTTAAKRRRFQAMRCIAPTRSDAPMINRKRWRDSQSLSMTVDASVSLSTNTWWCCRGVQRTCTRTLPNAHKRPENGCHTHQCDAAGTDDTGMRKHARLRAPAVPCEAHSTPVVPCEERSTPATPCDAHSTPAVPCEAHRAPAVPCEERSTPAVPCEAHSAPAVPCEAHSTPGVPAKHTARLRCLARDAARLWCLARPAARLRTPTDAYGRLRTPTEA